MPPTNPPSRSLAVFETCRIHDLRKRDERLTNADKERERRGKGGVATYHTNCAKPTTRGIETTESSTETTTVSTA
jgi:hypothetical protein